MANRISNVPAMAYTESVVIRRKLTVLAGHFLQGIYKSIIIPKNNKIPTAQNKILSGVMKVFKVVISVAWEEKKSAPVNKRQVKLKPMNFNM